MVSKHVEVALDEVDCIRLIYAYRHHFFSTQRLLIYSSQHFFSDRELHNSLVTLQSLHTN